MKPKEPLVIPSKPDNKKKIYFTDDGGVTEKPSKQPVIENGNSSRAKEKKLKFKKDFKHDESLAGSKWYQKFEEYNSEEIIDIKESDLKAFQELCKRCYNDETLKLKKNNPSDAKWLETALQKGTSKDRAHSGALLMQSNPLANFCALDSIISLTKFSNKTSVDVLETVTELFINALLPPTRKLKALQQRGSDWKTLKNKAVDSDTKNEIYAYWHFENELKDHYHSYLLNLQAALQNGKEINKIKAIISSSKLLQNCPEREGFLLTILVNKFGDPNKKIASKATYHLRQILFVHPNMANVMIMETEKLIFRNNINELAQHYGIGFLSLIAPIANIESSQKLINICFCFFKIKIEKGDVNSKTMQAILNCLRLAIKNINEFNTEKKKIEVTTPDVVSTIYRLIYLSNISIAFQALSLLLQLVFVQNENHDRFYNALYKKMSDLDIINANNKITSLYFHIVHRSIHEDSNLPRCKAFIKRLLQMALAFPAAKACGALIVISKILKARPELMSLYLKTTTAKETSTKEKRAPILFHDDNDTDEEEKYEDVKLEESSSESSTNKEKIQQSSSSWVHAKISEQQRVLGSENSSVPTKYDPYKRSAAFCGAELSLFYELSLVSKYFHPTVQVFVENIIKNQKIQYFGDPLKDFSLTHFLDRFSYKNPKKVDPKNEKSVFHHTYKPKGSRGQPVHSLTEQNCTEEERFIFDFLQRKREIKEKHIKFKDEDEQESDVESVNDDEFDEYLNSVGAASDYSKAEGDFDYMSEMQKESDAKIAKKKKSKGESDEQESINDDDDDWSGIDDESDDDSAIIDGSVTDHSIEEQDLMNESDEEPPSDQESGGSEEETELTVKSKTKGKKKMKDKGMENLFVAVDDFSDMIEKNTNSQHGTLGEIFNKDKSSQKQLDWEQKRHGQIAQRGFKRKNSFAKKSFNGKKKRF